LNDFSNYFFTIQQIKTALFSPKLVDEFTSLLIGGHSGCGKSTIVNLILNEHDIDILKINPTNYQNISTLHTTLKCFCTFESILFYFSKKPKLILLEDIDIIMNTDRYFLSFLNDILKNKNSVLTFTIKCPVICVMNSTYSKKYNDVKLLFKSTFLFKKLSFNQCFQIVDEILTKSYNDIVIDFDTITQLIKDNNNELRVVLNHLEEVILHSKKYISFQKKDSFLDYNSNDLAKHLINEDLDNDDIMSLITHDTNQIVSCVHENYYKGFYKSNTINKDELDLLSNMNHVLLYHDLLNNVSFDVSNSFLWENYIFSKLKSINYHCNNYKKTTLHQLMLPKIDFSQLINKQSLALNFNKKMLKMENNLTIHRNTCALPFMYIYYLLVYCEFEEYCNIVSKNEIEIIMRYLSEKEPSMKAKISKIKTTLLK
jgi:energy-coupling factor transporter ATP-binding protein EcfA2